MVAMVAGFAQISCTFLKLRGEVVVRPSSNVLSGLAVQTKSTVFVGHQPKRILGVMAAVARDSNGTPSSFSSAGATKSSGTVLETLDNLRMNREEETLEGLKRFTVPESERPTVRHDEWHGYADIPLIDLSRVETDRAEVATQLNKAAREWGLFQLLNHGLSLETLREVESQGFKFFDLPVEIKSRAGKEEGCHGGLAYTGDCTGDKATSLQWAESLQTMFGGGLDQLDGVIRQVWPEGNAEFRNAALKYCTAAARINKLLMELLAESLGLKSDFFSQHLNAKSTHPLRWNFYPACPRPSDVLGAISHTDLNALTILRPSEVGGLQVQKDGKWVALNPIEGALVVNIGDTMHAWTNGTFKSVLHRTVADSSVHRLSLAAFMSVDGDSTISAPEELIDESHPRQYKPFKAADYIMEVMSIRKQETDKTGSRDGLHVLEGFKLKD